MKPSYTYYGFMLGLLQGTGSAFAIATHMSLPWLLIPNLVGFVIFAALTTKEHREKI